MSEDRKDTFVILKYIDLNLGARVYRNDELWLNLDDDALYPEDDRINQFEKLLEKAKLSFKTIFLLGDADWDSMADLAFNVEWRDKPLSEVLREAHQREVETIVHRDMNF